MKLFRFRYSPFARKVQMTLDLLGARYELVEVPYSDRNELARTTGGYVHVPVLVDADRTFCSGLHRQRCATLGPRRANARSTCS